MDLAGKTAIVTGASRGIGKHLAVELGRRGMNVVVAARTVEARKRLPGTIGETVAAIEQAGGTGFAVAADMAQAEDLERLVSVTVERFGAIDVLVNNAAATADKSWGAALVDLTREDWMRQYAINLHAPFTLIRSVVPLMAVRGGGRIVNVTTGRHTGEAEDAVPGLTVPLAYPSSKAALDQFCFSVAPQLRAMGISIVNVHPGFVRTEMVDLMEQAGVDAASAISMDVPTRAMLHLLTVDDPFASSGQVVEAEVLVQGL